MKLYKEMILNKFSWAFNNNNNNNDDNNNNIIFEHQISI